MIVVRPLSVDELGRLAEIDRSEQVETGYRMHGATLEPYAAGWRIPNWFAVGEDHSVEAHVRSLGELAERGAFFLGAFDEDRLVGLLAWRPKLTETMDQLAFLHVSREHRRRGIASRLCDEAETAARNRGATSIYVSATPSESAVGFYRSRGFEPTSDIHLELFALEPDDIHMTKDLMA